MCCKEEQSADTYLKVEGASSTSTPWVCSESTEEAELCQGGKANYCTASCSVLLGSKLLSNYLWCLQSEMPGFALRQKQRFLGNVPP